MGLENLPSWLTNEVISNYIIFIAGILSGIIGWLIAKRLTQKKPSLIQVEKKYESELITIDDEVRERLQITYEGRPISSLYQAIFTINNISEAPIQNIDIHIYFDSLDEDDFLEAIFTNREEIQKIEVNPLGSDFEAFSIHIPYLNPRKEYEDYLEVTLYSPKPLLVKAVIGKGLGWSVKYLDKAETSERIIKAIANSSSPIGSIVANIVDIVVR